MTVGEMLARMSQAELIEWMAFLDLEASEKRNGGDSMPVKGSKEYWDMRLRGEL